MKKVLSLVITALMILSCCVSFAVSASAEDASFGSPVGGAYYTNISKGCTATLVSLTECKDPVDVIPKSDAVAKLTDGVIPAMKTSDSGWYCFSASSNNDRIYEVVIDLGKEYDNVAGFRAVINQINIWGVANPIEIRVFASNDNSKWLEVGVFDQSNATPADTANTGYTWFDLDLVNYLDARYIKFGVKCGVKASPYIGEFEVFAGTKNNAGFTGPVVPADCDTTNIALNKTVTYSDTVTASTTYVAGLTDGVKPADTSFSKNFQGLTASTGGDILIDLGETYDNIVGINVDHLTTLGGGVAPFDYLCAYISTDGVNYSKLGCLNGPDCNKGTKALVHSTLDFNNYVSGRYLKINFIAGNYYNSKSSTYKDNGIAMMSEIEVFASSIDKPVQSIGAQINAEKSAIRFGANFYNLEDKAEVEDIGMLVLPAAKLGEAELNLDLANDLVAKIHATGILNYEADKALADYEYVTFVAAICGIPEGHLSDDIVARPFVEYSNEETAYGEAMVRNYEAVAAKAAGQF